MKTARKALMLILCAALLVSATVMGTLAYLTSEDSVENTFTVGNVIITLDELDVDNSTEGANDRDKANAYHLLPGHTYTKDPTVHVATTSEDCFLFVTIDNQIANIEGENTVAEQMAANGWIPVEDEANTYVYVGTEEGATAPLAVSGGANVIVFEEIEIAGSVDNDTLADYEGVNVTVNAYAVQKDGFEDKTAEYIWGEAFGA